MSQANGTSDCICRNRLERPPAELQSIGRLPVAGRNTLPGTDNHAADRWLEDARPCSARIGARTGNRTRHSDRRPDPAPGRKPGPPQIRRTRKQKRTRRTGGVARQTRDHLSRDTRGATRDADGPLPYGQAPRNVTAARYVDGPVVQATTNCASLRRPPIMLAAAHYTYDYLRTRQPTRGDDGEAQPGWQRHPGRPRQRRPFP